MNWLDAQEATIVTGGIVVDDRGLLAFCNEVDLAGIRRFYLVSNHVPGRVRAWHGHRKERKLMWPLAGAMLVGVVSIDDWDHPSKQNAVKRFVLSAAKPQLLVVPPGHANGTMSLTSGATLLVLSNLVLEESVKDDFRFDARYWDAWEISER